MTRYNYVRERFPTVVRSDGIEQLLVPTPNCERCCLPISEDFAQSTGVCAYCHHDDPVDGTRLVGIVAAMLYIPRVEGYPHSQEIREFKDTGAHSQVFGELLVRALRERSPSVSPSSIGLLPSSTTRIPKDAVVDLGRRISQALRVSTVRPLRFSREVTTQRSTAGREARRENVRGAMEIDSRLPNGVTLLLDDVATTGFSLAEAARVALDAGATSALGLVVGRDSRLDYLARVGVITPIEE